jgi:hypothetical protein
LQSTAEFKADVLAKQVDHQGIVSSSHLVDIPSSSQFSSRVFSGDSVSHFSLCQSGSAATASRSGNLSPWVQSNGLVQPPSGSNRARGLLREVCMQSGLLELPIDKSTISSKHGLFETMATARPTIVAWKQGTSAWLKTHGKDQLIKAELSKAKLSELRALYDLLDADGGGTHPYFSALDTAVGPLCPLSVSLCFSLSLCLTLSLSVSLSSSREQVRFKRTRSQLH